MRRRSDRSNQGVILFGWTVKLPRCRRFNRWKRWKRRYRDRSGRGTFGPMKSILALEAALEDRMAKLALKKDAMEAMKVPMDRQSAEVDRTGPLALVLELVPAAAPVVHMKSSRAEARAMVVGAQVVQLQVVPVVAEAAAVEAPAVEATNRESPTNPPFHRVPRGCESHRSCCHHPQLL